MIRGIRGAMSLALVVLTSLTLTAPGQDLGTRTVPDNQAAGQTKPPVDPVAESDPYFKSIYRTFYDTYKLGPGDLIAIRVANQPDYSLDNVKVSPVGRIYIPLIGEREVVGMTISDLTRRLTAEFSQYIIDARVTVSLIDAASAKIGVLGDVARPSILTMGGPMTVFDAITAAGGVTEFGNRSKVTVLRQKGDGRYNKLEVNVKKIMEAKADPEENFMLQGGDTIIVSGNFKKTFGEITSYMGFGYFLTYLGDYARRGVGSRP